MVISIIVAMGMQGELGIDGKLPWRIPEDLKHFKNLTEGKTVVMGRKTYESIGKALPNRENVILTRQENYIAKDAIIKTNAFELFWHMAEKKDEVFVIGGRELYTLFLPWADKMYITRIEAEFNADTYFPSIHYDKWKLIDVRDRADISSPYRYSFEVYENSFKAYENGELMKGK